MRLFADDDWAATRNTVFTAAYSGDAQYAPAAVTRVVSVRVQVSVTLLGYARSQHIGKTTYRVYHRTSPVRAGVTVSPDKRAECAEFELQQYRRGAWRPGTSSACIVLSKASQATGTIRVRHAAIRGRYRIRADFLGSSSDVANLSNDSSWQYLTIEK